MDEDEELQEEEEQDSLNDPQADPLNDPQVFEEQVAGDQLRDYDAVDDQADEDDDVDEEY